MAESSVLRRSLRLQQERDRPKAGTVVYGVSELLTEIINHCSWASRVSLSHATIHSRLVVQDSIHRQVYSLLNPFVDDLPAFFDLLHETRAAIVGSTAWNVMTVDNLGPRDLNIVIPNGSVYGIERLKALLSCSGTTVVFDGFPGIVYENCASRFIRLIRKSVSVVSSFFVPAT
jgi:hypothetical protein